jgi:hypothetical protein
MNTMTGRALRVAAFACAALSMTACATVVRGVHQKWTVESDPVGAQVTTTNGFSCDATPCTFTMERKAKFEVTVSKEGYKAYKGHIDHEVSGGGGAAMAGNVIAGGLIGVGVDASTGAMDDLKPNPLRVHLERDGSSGPSTAEGRTGEPKKADSPN